MFFYLVPDTEVHQNWTTSSWTNNSWFGVIGLFIVLLGFITYNRSNAEKDPKLDTSPLLEEEPNLIKNNIELALQREQKSSFLTNVSTKPTEDGGTTPILS